MRNISKKLMCLISVFLIYYLSPAYADCGKHYSGYDLIFENKTNDIYHFDSDKMENHSIKGISNSCYGADVGPSGQCVITVCGLTERGRYPNFKAEVYRYKCNGSNTCTTKFQVNVNDQSIKRIDGNDTNSVTATHPRISYGEAGVITAK